jgi:hypothetical protein
LRGRKTSDSGVRARFYRAVTEAHLSKIILADLQTFSWCALAALSRIQRHDAMINNTHPVTGLSTMNKEQNEILSALRIKKPTLKTQLSLL